MLVLASKETIETVGLPGRNSWSRTRQWTTQVLPFTPSGALLPPPVPQMLILTSNDAINAIWSRADHSWRSGEDTAQIALAIPAITISPTVPEVTISSPVETIEMPRPKRGNGRSGVQMPAQVSLFLPSTVIPAVKQPVVLAPVETINPASCTGPQEMAAGADVRTPPRSPSPLHCSSS